MAKFTILNRRGAPLSALIITIAFIFSYLLYFSLPLLHQEGEGRMGDLLFQLRYRLKGHEETVGSLVLFNIGDKDIRELKITDSERAIYGRIIEELMQAEAKTVVFDIIFAEPVDPAGDRKLVGETAKSGSILFPVSLNEQSGLLSEGASKEIIDKVLWQPLVLKSGRPYNSPIILYPFEKLSEAAAGLGTIIFRPDGDGVTRRLPLLITYRESNDYIPSLVLRALCNYLQVDPDTIEVTFGKHIRLRGATVPPFGVKKDFTIPIDRKGRMVVNYAGPWHDSLENYPVSEIFNFSERYKADLSELLADSMVIITDISSVKRDYSRGIFDEDYPNCGIISNAINTILTENYLRVPTFPEVLAVSLLLALLIWLASAYFRAGRFILTVPLFLLVAVTFEGLLFIYANRLAVIQLHLLCTVTAASAVVLYKYYLLTRSVRGLQQAVTGEVTGEQQAFPADVPVIEQEESVPQSTAIEEHSHSNESNKEEGEPVINDVEKVQLEEPPEVNICEKACRDYDITPRQREVLILLCRGYTYKKVAETLQITEGTIKRQVSRIKEKTDLYHKSDLLKLFFP